MLVITGFENRGEYLNLDDDTRVICGHGPETTVGFERRSNPFFA